MLRLDYGFFSLSKEDHLRCTKICTRRLEKINSVDKRLYVPIPMTVPYSDLSSAFTETGHKRMRARRAKKTIEREEKATLRARVLDGRRGERFMGVVGGCGGGHCQRRFRRRRRVVDPFYFFLPSSKPRRQPRITFPRLIRLEKSIFASFFLFL